jgi:hypothetical protein
MADANLDAVNLAAVPVGGTIHEDLMDAIFDVSPVERPFCDAIGSGSSDNQYKEWVREALEAADPDNAVVDGADAGDDQSVTGERLGNYHQIGSKVVKVSDRGRNVNTVGSSDELIRQLMKRQKALRRDEEAALVSRNVAVAGDGSTTAGKCAGVGGWIGVAILGTAGNTSDRGVDGVDPVLTGGVGGGGYPTTGAVAGTPRALSETSIKNMMREAYINGGNPTMAMSTPACIEVLSDYLFTSSARVATLQSNAPQGNRTDNGSGAGRSGSGVTAQGAVNILVTNFGTLELVPNRFQPEVAAGVADLYLIDPDTWERSYLQGYETNPLARTGIAENRQISVDYTLCALNPEANAVVADIDTTTAAVA